MSKILGILDEVQKGEAVQSKSLQALHKLYKKDSDGFKQELIPLLQRILITTQNDSSVEKILSFLSKFTIKYSNESDEFIDFLLGYLLDVTGVLDKTIRYAETS